MEKFIKSFVDIFKEPEGLPPPRSHHHQILLKQDMEPICVKSYQYPHLLKNEIEKKVADLLSTGMIHLSLSPYSSLVLLVKKHYSSWRLCVDYQALNKNIVKDKFSIPVIDELLDEPHRARLFTKLDFISGYHHSQDYIQNTSSAL